MGAFLTPHPVFAILKHSSRKNFDRALSGIPFEYCCRTLSGSACQSVNGFSHEYWIAEMTLT